MMHKKHQPEMEKMVENEILLADSIDKDKMKKMAKMDESMGPLTHPFLPFFSFCLYQLSQLVKFRFQPFFPFLADVFCASSR